MLATAMNKFGFFDQQMDIHMFSVAERVVDHSKPTDRKHSRRLSLLATLGIPASQDKAI